VLPIIRSSRPTLWCHSILFGPTSVIEVYTLGCSCISYSSSMLFESDPGVNFLLNLAVSFMMWCGRGRRGQALIGMIYRDSILRYQGLPDGKQQQSTDYRLSDSISSSVTHTPLAKRTVQATYKTKYYFFNTVFLPFICTRWQKHKHKYTSYWSTEGSLSNSSVDEVRSLISTLSEVCFMLDCALLHCGGVILIAIHSTRPLNPVVL